MEKQSQNKALIAVVVIVLLAAAATAAIVLTNNNSSTNTSTTSETASDLPTNAPASESNGESTPANATFTNGTYSSTGSYQTPGGTETIGVKVTLTDGVVTDAQITKQGMTGEAKEYQAAFESGYKSQVVGKKISEVSLNRVAGSSLTSKGFNDAINDIEKQAQS